MLLLNRNEYSQTPFKTARLPGASHLLQATGSIAPWSITFHKGSFCQPRINLSAAYWRPSLVFPLCCCEVSGSSEWYLVSQSPSIPSWDFRRGSLSTFRNTVSHWGPQLRVLVWTTGFNSNSVCLSHHCSICGTEQTLATIFSAWWLNRYLSAGEVGIILPIYCAVGKLTSKISKTCNSFFFQRIVRGEIESSQKYSFVENFPQGLLKCLTKFWLHKEMIWCRWKNLSIEIKQIYGWIAELSLHTLYNLTGQGT